MKCVTSAWKEDVAFRTDAIVSSVSVDASAHSANERILNALVDVFTKNNLNDRRNLKEEEKVYPNTWRCRRRFGSRRCRCT